MQKPGLSMGTWMTEIYRGRRQRRQTSYSVHQHYSIVLEARPFSDSSSLSILRQCRQRKRRIRSHQWTCGPCNKKIGIRYLFAENGKHTGRAYSPPIKLFRSLRKRRIHWIGGAQHCGEQIQGFTPFGLASCTDAHQRKGQRAGCVSPRFMAFAYLLRDGLNRCKIKQYCSLGYCGVDCEGRQVEFPVAKDASQASRGIDDSGKHVFSPGADPKCGFDCKHMPLKILVCLAMISLIEWKCQ